MVFLNDSLHVLGGFMVFLIDSLHALGILWYF